MSEIRQVLRGLRKQPLHTGAAVLAFGLAIAANTAIFTVADALVFHPLELPEIGRLVTVHGGPEGTKFGGIQMSPADYFDLREATRTLEVAATRYAAVTLTGTGEAERLQAVDVTPNFLEVMGVRPLVGSGFDPAGERRELLLGYDFWQRRFGGSREVVGTTVRLNGEPHTVIGVAPASLRYPNLGEVWRGLRMTPQVRAERGSFDWAVMGRLKPGASLGEAANEVREWGRRLAKAYPDTHAKRGATVFPLREMVSGAFTADYMRLALWAMGVLMAIACANVANLQVARISGRQREFSLRLALGSSRWRMAGNVLLESLLLGLGGLAVGALIAVWMVDVLRGSMPAEVIVFLPGWRQMGLNQAALWYAGAISVLASVAAGMWPAWRASGLDLAEALKQGGRNMAGPERGRFRNGLVTVQVALSLVLLVGGLLIGKGTASFGQSAVTFEAERLLSARLNLPPDRYRTAKEREQFLTRLLEALRESPRVAEASMTTNLPYSGDWWTASFEKEGLVGRPSDRPTVLVERADEQFFRMIRVPLRAGRNLRASDREGAEPVAVVNEALAARLFPGQDALGKRFRLGEGEGSVKIVGVSGNYLHDWILRQPQPMVYLPYRQQPSGAATILLRPREGAAVELAGVLRKAVAALDEQQPVFEVRLFAQAVREQLIGLWYMAGILGMAGMLALMLSATGLFSVLSFVVTERTREVGLRMALGAQPGTVLKMMLGQGLLLVAVGLALGTGGSVLLGRLLSELIFGTEAVDGWVLAGGWALLLAMGGLACYLPARRAALVDPMVALRQE